MDVHIDLRAAQGLPIGPLILAFCILACVPLTALPCYFAWRLTSRLPAWLRLFAGTLPLVFAIAIVLTACSSCTHVFMAKWPPAVDPLIGWNSWSEGDEELQPNAFGYHGTTIVGRTRPGKHAPLYKAIKDDYRNYLQKNGCYEGGTCSFYEDGTGQHAVKVEVVDKHNDDMMFIFMYDKFNKRMKVMKFFECHASC